jgi:uncharacterized protein (DUF1697 family)
MIRYACMLRAVNVSGARKLKMTELRDLCVALGFSDVTTYLQSGNVVLATNEPQARIGPTLSAAIGREFGYGDVTVLAWTAAELRALIAANPFVARGCAPAKLHVTFLAAGPAPAALSRLDAARYLPDELAAGKRAVYVHCPNGYGRTKLNNSFFERTLGFPATTRNWNTTTRLFELARG